MDVLFQIQILSLIQFINVTILTIKPYISSGVDIQVGPGAMNTELGLPKQRNRLT